MRAIFIFIAGCLLLSGQVVFALDVAFDDVNLQACVAQVAEKNGWKNPEQITQLECHNKNIKSIGGINHLVNLQSLSLYNNLITDITGLHLTQLTQLNLAKNRLTQCELTDFPALETLFVFNNQLQMLNLHGLPRLTLLKGNNNMIKNFTYADLPQLEKLYLFDNKMVTIDIYRLPHIHYMDIRQNPMPDKLYEEMDKLSGITFLHNGNSRDWN